MTGPVPHGRFAKKIGPIRAVIIDLDGTLLDTAADLAAAANAIRADFGLAQLSAQRLAGFVGRGADVLMHRALTDNPDGQLNASEFARARAAFDVHYARENGRWAKPYEGVIAGLECMSRQALRMACVTNKPQQFAQPLLDQHQMSRYFEILLGGDALPQRKPDPLPLLHVASRFALDPAHCLMIGDSVNDAKAARAAGMPIAILPYGYNEGNSVESIDCDGIFDSILDISRAIQ